MTRINRFCYVLTLLLCAMMLYGRPAQAADATTICETYTNRIIEQLVNKQPLAAIGTGAEYEEALLALYPPSQFKGDVFTSEMNHLSLRNPFTDWTVDDEAAKQFPGWISAVGFDLLFFLNEQTQGGGLLAFSFDVGRLEQRISYAAEEGKTSFTDEELRRTVQQIFEQFGVVKGWQVKTIDNHRVNYTEIGMMDLEQPAVAACLTRGRQIYGFLLFTPTEDRLNNEKKFAELIGSVDLNYQPADDDAISAVEKRITDVTDVRQTLAAVRELARIGEYGSAAQQLSRMRTLIADRMPMPAVEGNIARYPGYGIIVQNPNPAKWKLSTDTQGGMGMIILENPFSVTPSGVMVIAVNTIIAYGPKAARMMLNDSNDEEKKTVLSGAGHGALLRFGRTITEERYRLFKGRLAYEGVVTTNIPGTNMKGIVFVKGNALIMIVMMVPTTNFTASVKEYEAVIDKYISFGEK